MTDERDGPALLDGAGRIRIDAVNRLAMADLARWLAEVLLGDRVASGADRDDSPVDLLTRTYHRLDPWVRQAFQDVLLELLSELARAVERGGGRWTGAAAEHLLLLVAAVAPGTPRVQVAIELLRAIASAEPGAGGGGDEAVPVFALKSLVALDHRAPPEFWLPHYDRRGGRAAGPVLRGLVRWDLGVAFRWIEDHARDPALAAALRAQLPLLVDRFGRRIVLDYLARLAPRLSGDDRAALDGTCRALRIGGLDPVPARPAMVDPGVAAWSSGAGRAVARGFDLAPAPTRYLADPRLLDDAGLSEIADPAELRDRLTADLRALDPASDRPGYVRALLVLASSLLDAAELYHAVNRLLAWCAEGAVVPDARRHALIAIFEELDRAPGTGELSFELQACAYMLRNQSLNVHGEFDRIASRPES